MPFGGVPHVDSSTDVNGDAPDLAGVRYVQHASKALLRHKRSDLCCGSIYRVCRRAVCRSGSNGQRYIKDARLDKTPCRRGFSRYVASFGPITLTR